MTSRPDELILIFLDSNMIGNEGGIEYHEEPIEYHDQECYSFYITHHINFASKKPRTLTVIFRCSSNIPKKPAQQGEIKYEEAPVQGETYVSYLLWKWGSLAYI